MGPNITEELSKRRIAAKAELSRAGIDVPRKPHAELPRLPGNLSELGDDQLMRRMVEFTRYQDYVSGQLTLDEIDESEILQKLDLAKARHLVKGWGGKSVDTVAIAKANALVDPDVQELTNVYEVKRAHRKLLGMMVETLSRDGGVVSRELTRRIGRGDQERRADKYS